MRNRRQGLIGVVVAAAATLAIAAQAGAAPGSAHVWVTSPDGAMKLSDRGTVPFHAGPSDALTVTVDPSRRYQRMAGFGASITDSSAAVLYRLDRRKREATMADLFSPDGGDGLSVLRQPIGASDFVDGDFYTYDDVPAGRTDYDLRHFSIAHDERQILPLLRQALRLNPKLKVIGTPWSPPAWMKTSGSLIGGRLIDSPRIYDAYARYFVKFVQAYEKAGVPIHALTVQNEPQNRRPRGYPGTDMPVAQAAKLIEALGPALRRAGLDTKILGYDHNWAEHPDDVNTTPPGEDPETEYPSDLLSSDAGRWIAGTAFHCYAGDPARQTELQHRFPDKGVWFTECSGSHGATDPPEWIFESTLRWHTRNVVIHTTRNWAKTVVNWNLARATRRPWTSRSATPTARPPSSSSTTTARSSRSACGRTAGRSPTRCRRIPSRRSPGRPADGQAAANASTPVSSPETAHSRAASSGSIACASTPRIRASGAPTTVGAAMSQSSQ
jgi:glucosylceramidase